MGECPLRGSSAVLVELAPCYPRPFAQAGAAAGFVTDVIIGRRLAHEAARKQSKINARCVLMVDGVARKRHSQ